MSKSQSTPPNIKGAHIKKNSAAKDRLASALRDNLKRRKAGDKKSKQDG